VAEPGSRRGLGAALLASSLMPLNSTMIAVALPEIAREFARAPGTVAQAVVASYLVAAIVLQSPGGKLSATAWATGASSPSARCWWSPVPCWEWSQGHSSYSPWSAC
jgi:MFS family permease